MRPVLFEYRSCGAARAQSFDAIDLLHHRDRALDGERRRSIELDVPKGSDSKALVETYNPSS